jgi:hypothetical protein
LRLNDEHYTPEGISKVELAKSSMNNSRTYFNWDHLDNFPDLPGPRGPYGPRGQ